MITSFAVWFCYLEFEAIYILFFCSVFINICFLWLFTYYAFILVIWVYFIEILLPGYCRISCLYFKKKVFGNSVFNKVSVIFCSVEPIHGFIYLCIFLSTQLFCQSFDQVYCNLIPLLSLHFFLVKGISF